MRSTNKTALGLLQPCLCLALVFGNGIATTSAIAQKRSERDRENESEVAPSMSTETWAKGFVKLHDKNKNGWLDGEELKAAGRRAESADFNHDKAITVEELVASATKGSSKSPPSTATTTKPSEPTEKLSDKQDGEGEDGDRPELRRGGYGRRSDGERSGGDSKSKPTSKRVLTWTGDRGKTGDAEKKARRTYRFTPANEKLPTGLPSWFKSQDKNGDGQVAMSEYSRSWSKSTVAKFERYDLDGDGIVTAKEAAGTK